VSEFRFASYSLFLMHRAELKVSVHFWCLFESYVPNVPLGAENVELKEKGLNF
jgi:hypothetical protein